MSYVKAYIPTCETFGWEGGNGFNTRIVAMMNGRERRNAEWDQPQHFYSVPFRNITQPQYAPIKQMHLNRRGRWGCFLFRDRLDWQANNEVFAVAEAGQEIFQLAKWSTIDGVSYRREVHAIYAPNENGTAASNAVSITSNNVPVLSGWTLNRDTGVVTFAAPLSGGEILRWTGEFSVWVRFDNDRLPMSIDNKGTGDDIFINGSIELIEQPPPSS